MLAEGTSEPPSPIYEQLDTPNISPTTAMELQEGVAEILRTLTNAAANIRYTVRQISKYNAYSTLAGFQNQITYLRNPRLYVNFVIAMPTAFSILYFNDLELEDFDKDSLEKHGLDFMVNVGFQVAGKSLGEITCKFLLSCFTKMLINASPSEMTYKKLLAIQDIENAYKHIEAALKAGLITLSDIATKQQPEIPGDPTSISTRFEQLAKTHNQMASKKILTTLIIANIVKWVTPQWRELKTRYRFLAVGLLTLSLTLLWVPPKWLNNLLSCLVQMLGVLSSCGAQLCASICCFSPCCKSRFRKSLKVAHLPPPPTGLPKPPPTAVTLANAVAAGEQKGILKRPQQPDYGSVGPV